MKCPKCNISLLMSEKQGIEIDYCPDCRGIWLDRGELEKIIEKSFADVQSGDRTFERSGTGDYKHHDDHHYSHDGRYGRKRNFLTELFD
jgi:uncharacterized protein